ncbi:hypothetical protein B4099_0783 [Heyndrickxia coagulans]|uniref:Uncharacterized protein n=1 Tax=Heyndrickxia coagulans TaxID=1398 RepID=A0A150KE81_HEYCO|nr:hypothetical protein B4099_0783 [Heyndrickxia coagulans]
MLNKRFQYPFYAYDTQTVYLIHIEKGFYFSFHYCIKKFCNIRIILILLACMCILYL